MASALAVVVAPWARMEEASAEVVPATEAAGSVYLFQVNAVATLVAALVPKMTVRMEDAIVRVRVVGMNEAAIAPAR